MSMADEEYLEELCRPQAPTDPGPGDWVTFTFDGVDSVGVIWRVYENGRRGLWCEIVVHPHCTLGMPLREVRKTHPRWGES